MENKDFEIEQESLDMNNMALSNVTKYLATYKNPKEWILDEKEAKAARVLKSVAPEKSSKVGSLAYSAGEVLRTTAALPRQFIGSVDLLSSALKDRFYPNAEESALQRWANNYGKLEAQREETNQELISQEVGDIDWYTWGAAGGQLIRDIALTGGIAKLGAKAATKAAEKRLAGTLAGEEVAQRYTRLMAGEGAKKAGSAAITGSVFAQEVGSRTVDDINQYIARTGDTDLKYYDPSVDLAVNIGVGALSAQIEKGLGVERFVPRLIARGAGEKIPGLTQILARGAEGMVGESLEEGAQETAGQIGEMIKGYRDWWDFDTDQILTSMTIGGVLGGTAGAGLYYINRRTAINRLVNEGMDKNLAADLVDTIASREINKTINNLSAATELNTKNGEAYDKLKAGIKRALELQGWSEKMIDPKTGAELSIDEYVDLTVNSQIINTAVREAFNSGITIDEFLDVAQFTAVDNFMVLRPLGTTEEINARIDEQKAIIARQQDLKKTGAGDNTILREAKMKKAILEKVRLNKIVNDEIQKVNLEEAKTPENVKEIETADKDVEALKTAPTASDFNASLDNNLTTAQKTKRLGNAVLKKIFGSDKLGFDSVITLPEYTNAKTALTNSAERIINFAKKHRTYGIQTDLRNALNLMRTVNQGNFLEHATTPSLDGTDVIAQNAFLYHFLFKDADTTSAFIDAYLERAEASISGETDTKLTKKDLVGQAFKATDSLMQVQAESAGIEYDSIYNEDGSYKDQNVAAVMMSYQNQFVQEPTQLTLFQPEQFDLADENARLDDIYPEYTGETIEVDGKERTVYNSNGDRIAKSKEALTNFWRWFGDSKVVDEQGRPLVVYHGTNAEFDTFEKDRIGDFGKGYYFTTSRENAEQYANKKGGNIVMPVYLSIKNVYEAPGNSGQFLYNLRDKKTSAKQAQGVLLEQGFNGIEIKQFDGKEKYFVVFNSTQIKSVDNRGTYSSDTGNIYYQDETSDKNLVATHAIRLDGMKQALRVGGFAMPSLAIKKDLDNTYGEIIFVAPAEMAKPSRTTKVYDRDAWTPMINFIEYKSKDGFYDRVKEILAQRGIDPKSASSFVYNIEEKMKEGVAEWNTTAVELFGIDKGYIERGEEDEMRSLINQNSDIREEYNKWYEEFIIPNMSTRIFRGFTNLGNRRYVPATLENIVKELKTQPEHRDFGWNDTYFFHDVARELVSRFKTIKEIKKASGRLIDNTKVVDKINELSSEYYALAEELKVDESSHNPEILLSLALIEGKGSTAEKLEAVGLKSDKDSVKKVDAIVKKIKELPTKYFEGKVRRAVRFNEFSAVFVPEGRKYDEVASQLSEQDANVIRYDSSYDLDDKFAQLTQEKQNILFQHQQANGFFDPELNVILLGKNWNTMTLPHELAHYWLNTLFNVYKRVQSGELKANAEWIQEKKDMFAILDIDENQDALTAGQQEKFARMTEAYLTGIGVSKEMSQTFKDFFAWVPEKYKSILQLGYLDDQGKLQYPFLDQKAVDFFNRWYENASLPSLPTSPERQRFMNVTGDDNKVEKVSIKEMNDREKEFAQDAEEQQRTDARLYNTLDENMPADIKPVADAQKVVIDERSNFLKESQAQQVQVAEEPKRRWFERKSRETETQKAQEYIEKNPEHAKEVIFGDPELIPNDTGVDRATLINTYMALNNITPDNPDWATLHTNIAINQSLAGTQLALSNDKSYGTYLDALREVENALELKAATNYAGSKNGARERFNADIQRFLDKELPAIFATQPNSKEREVALRAMFEKARTTFSGNTTGSFLNQVDLDYAKGQTKKTEAFMRWAINQIKKDAGAKLNNEQQAKLLQISAKAQQAMEDLDNRDAGKAVAAAQELRNWQMEKQALMGISPQKFSLFGDYAPRAMLASFNTLVVANVPSTAINTVVVNATKTGLFGKNEVSKELIDSEVKRIKAIYGATGMNLAQMEKPTSPSLLHGEKYSAVGQKWYDPYTILGKEDNFFRVPTFVNTLAQIASTDAKATGRSADDVFREYASINNQTDEAKLARKQALAVANMAVFTQNGALANCLNHIRSELNKLSRVTLGLEPEGFGLGNLIAPFLTTGANIAEMGIRGSLAPITTITTMVNRWRTGKALDPMKKLALRMDWTYFTMSAVSMVLLAALTSDDDDFYTDPYRTGIKYSPDKPYDSINIAGVWLDLDFFGPFSIPMRTAAKVIQAWKKDNGIESVAKGYAESAKSVLGDIPLAESIINNQVNWAVKKPGSWASSYVYTQANKLVPAQIKPISRAVSRSEDWIFEPFEGTTVGRKFNRNYGFDGAELTTQDLIELFTIKVQLDQSLNQNL